jgi:hypothetical protein
MFLVAFFCLLRRHFVVVVVVLPTAFGVSLLIGLLAFPLCGGAPTFLCRRKEK